MCTLTLVRNQNEGYVLTFNRDEIIERSNTVLKADKDNGLIYPVDTKHGGTWLCYHPDQKRFACLLNGAFTIHTRTPPYRMSRGLVVLESFGYPSIQSFVTDYDFTNIEPFTMILGQDYEFLELRWDGHQKYFKCIADQNSIYSSCTLYDDQDNDMRQQWFDQLIHQSDCPLDKIDIWQFHQKSYELNPSIGINMIRPNGPKTVSTSQLTFDNYEFNFKYFEHQSKKMLSVNTIVK
jgi:hypothetical protein